MIYTTTMTVEVNKKTQEQIGKKLREIRERKNLLQEDVAKIVGISITYYAGIERGEENPSITIIEYICKALRVKSSDILPF
jgi:transcriptional regulator with XRE-family HTH domain